MGAKPTRIVPHDGESDRGDRTRKVSLHGDHGYTSMTMSEATQQEGENRDHGERRFVLYDVPWWTYVALRDAMDERHPGLKMTYLEGALELMSPSDLHE